jgi:hypothetical protein
VSLPLPRIWTWTPYLGLRPVSGPVGPVSEPMARIWFLGPYLGLRPVSGIEARIWA